MVEVIGVPTGFAEAVAFLDTTRKPPFPPYEFEKWFALTYNRGIVMNGNGKALPQMWFYKGSDKIMVKVVTDKTPPFDTIEKFNNEITQNNAQGGVVLSLYDAPYLAMLGIQNTPRIDFISLESHFGEVSHD